ncbi:MAG TPA: hypothetical protein VFK47_21810, partial [Ktedonobacteraceae bacterium]|nr:hypothetical protein [Ktedonobacteraceae bacterium]
LWATSREERHLLQRLFKEMSIQPITIHSDESSSPVESEISSSELIERSTSPQLSEDDSETDIVMDP